ncbi:MAG: hypothetical protein H6R13_646 [Proteobacteria bacterium]|nr:hypothetical protein [Pseudomonadota bacterium]
MLAFMRVNSALEEAEASVIRSILLVKIRLQALKGLIAKLGIYRCHFSMEIP